MDWRYEYVDLEKIRELMEKTDGWEESRQQEFYVYMQEQKDTLFKSEFGDLFLQMYEKKLGERDLEIIRSRRVKHPEPEQKARPFWLWRVLPVLLLSVSVSAGSIWIYRKAQDADAKRHLEQLQAQVGQENGQAQGTGDLEQTGGAPEPGSGGTQPEGAAATEPDGPSDAKEQPDGGAAPEETPPVLEQYRELFEQYPELFGWLVIPNTGINYPVMQPAAEKDYYLHHNFEGATDDEGALFVDPSSRGYPADDNLVIYGHNMKNGHMFGELKNYGTESYFQANREILFHTLYETGSYEVVTVLQTHIREETENGFRYYQFFNYETEEQFRECVNFIQENQIYDVENELTYGDRLLMLSTCDYAQDNGRFVVVARKTGP